MASVTREMGSLITITKKITRNSRKSMSAGVPETTMPQIRGGGEECGRPCWFIANEGVEVAGANGDHENLSSAKILHKKTTRKKFNGT